MNQSWLRGGRWGAGPPPARPLTTHGSRLTAHGSLLSRRRPLGGETGDEGGPAVLDLEDEGLLLGDVPALGVGPVELAAEQVVLELLHRPGEGGALGGARVLDRLG